MVCERSLLTTTVVRFLGLAATLLSLGSPFTAAQELHNLLDQSSPQTQLLPTVQQLKHLLTALETKIARAGFADSLLGWHLWVTAPESGLRTLFVRDEEETVLRNSTNDDPAIENNGSRNGLPPDPSQPWHLGGHNFPPTARRTSDDGEPMRAYQNVRIKDASASNSSQNLAYPPGGIIFKIARTLSELERIGEATFAIIKTPPCTAVWIIAFVHWCLGVEPILRRVDNSNSDERGLVLQHSQSKVLVEISGDSTPTEINVQTFKKIGSFDKLLGDSRIFFKSRPPWSGMVKVQSYFRSRVHDLQTYHRLYHVEDSLKVLIRDLSSRFRTCIPSLTQWISKPFPEPEVLLKVFTRIFDDEIRFEIPATIEIQKIWSQFDLSQVDRVSGLFLDFLMVSLYENVHVDDDIDLYLDTKWMFWNNSKPAQDLLEDVSSHLVGRLRLSFKLIIGLELIDKAMLGMIAVRTENPLPLIVSERGQVAYLAFIETMDLNGSCINARRVFPGSLLYQGENYAYVVSEDNTELSNTLDPSGANDEDYSSIPFEVKGFAEAESTWLGTIQDNYLKFYYVSDLNTSLSINPTLFWKSVECLIFMNGCTENCGRSNEADTKLFETELLHCRSVSAAISMTRHEMLRVLSSSGKQAHSLFVKAALTQLWINSGGTLVWPHTPITIVRNSSCLRCAGETALNILRDVTPHSVSHPTAIIID